MAKAPPRAICVVTGSRADFGLLHPVMEHLRMDPRLRLQVLVAGMHLDPEHGLTIHDVEKHFSVDARAPMQNVDDSGRGMAEGLAEGIRGMARAFQKLRPDVVLLLGDRDEALAAALAASHMAIPVAHIHGGDVSCAGVDDANRHAITKLSQIHFPATRMSARRILRLGEDPEHVHVVGSPAIDDICATRFLTRLEVWQRLHLPPHEDVLVVVQHPLSYSPTTAGAEMQEVLSAVTASRMPAVVIFPNSDPGSRQIIQAIRRHARPPQYRQFKSLDREFFLSLLLYARAMIGNSSSGIIDASWFRIPSIQVGARQAGRERGANVIEVAPRRKPIAAALRRALHDRSFRRALARGRCPYGDGRAGERIAEILAAVTLDARLLQKRLHYPAKP